jgi:hypothetical protein
MQKTPEETEQEFLKYFKTYYVFYALHVQKQYFMQNTKQLQKY